MGKPEQPTAAKLTTMQVSIENRRELEGLKPFGIPMKDWFNEQLAAWIQCHKTTLKISAS